jgi:F-type H+-transporting ATPase subunit delta
VDPSGSVDPNGSVSPVATAYAEAFVDIAEKNSLLSSVRDDLLLVKQCFFEMPALLLRLRMPSLNGKQRYRIVEKAFGGSLHSLTMRLIGLVIRNGRIRLLTEMYNAFEKVCERRANIIDVKVTCARPVDAGQMAQFEAVVKRRFGAGSRITYATDLALIAGYCISTAENSVDCSVRSGLLQLRKQLLHR